VKGRYYLAVIDIEKSVYNLKNNEKMKCIVNYIQNIPSSLITVINEYININISIKHDK